MLSQSDSHGPDASLRGIRIRTIAKCALLVLVAAAARASHDDSVGARFVDGDGTNVSHCLDHDQPCATIQYALQQAEAGNTVKVAAGIYDAWDLDPDQLFFGGKRAAGGYAEGSHYQTQDRIANRTVLIGVDSRYRQAIMRQGFTWAVDRASAERGLFDDSTPATLQSKAAVPATCTQGLAGQFPCRNVDFLSQLALADFSSRPASAANVWGFVDLNDNREYAVVGLSNGTAVVDVTDPANPRVISVIQGNNSPWREVKIHQVRDAAAGRYRAYAYVTTEAPGSGLQIIDLSALPNSVTLAGTLNDTSSQHTAYISNIDYATNVALPGAQAFLYLAGSNVNNGAWRAYSLANPASPQLVASAPTGSGYMHDSASILLTDSRTNQCDQGHNPCEVLIDFNVQSVDLWDVTDKARPVRLSTTAYPNVTYAHSGWPTVDQRGVIIHDELEEIQRGLNTQIYTLNIDDLRTPTAQISFRGPNTTTDHNGYSKGSKYYVSHYRRGLVVFDISNPQQLTEVGNFDTFLAPAANSAGTDGAWGVYPYLPSGTILISDIDNGLFMLREQVISPNSVGRIGFVASSGTVTEGTATITVRVQRVAGFAGAVSVDYATVSGTAVAGTDFTATAGSLQWAAGEQGEKTIVVPIANNATVTGSRSFQVNLSNLGGGAALDGAASFSVTIQEDDVAPPPAATGGGGGGGSITAAWLLILLACWALSPRHASLSPRAPARR
jgi:choice-of-anchor B domain-containing protein